MKTQISGHQHELVNELERLKNELEHWRSEAKAYRKSMLLKCDEIARLKQGNCPHYRTKILTSGDPDVQREVCLDCGSPNVAQSRAGTESNG